MRSVQVGTLPPHPHLLNFPYCIRCRNVCISIHYRHTVSDSDGLSIVLKHLMCVGQTGNCRYVRKESNSSALLQIPFPEEKPFINIKQLKSCQILISLNIHIGLVPLNRKNMTQNNVGVGRALSSPLTHDCTLPSQPAAKTTQEAHGGLESLWMNQLKNICTIRKSAYSVSSTDLLTMTK